MNQIDLSFIASKLESFEETIIYKLIDRAQYCRNQVAYKKGKSGFGKEESRSLMELRVYYQENMDSIFGRYCIPEERPFNTLLSPPKRQIELSQKDLYIDNFNKINLTSSILPKYLDLISAICPKGDDGHYGSSVEYDVYALQAISRRIHFGAMYVAESKFRASPSEYQKLIDHNDKDGLLKRLTRPEVESRIIERIAKKTSALQTCSNSNTRNIITPESIVDFYKNTVIPLTKEGEIIYLLNRKEELNT
ncbi:hypothetical protein CHISP_2241 [Chitinispirillum alkaliphilum]|nr:hypothetical protein CHISP_2241 [Chitinispirillum alkaliphilum]